MNGTLIPRLHVGRGETAGGLTLFPLWADGAEPPATYVTGPSLDGADWLVISELGSGPSVPELVVENQGDHTVLLLEGEMVAGGSQTRMLNVDVFVPEQSTLTIPVSCVEQGRWSAPGASRRARVRAPLGLRNVTASSVHDARRYGSRRSDQGEVWATVVGYQGRSGVSSPTGSYLDVAEAINEQVDELASAFAPPRTGQCGVVFGIGGRVHGLELFDSERALRAHWAELVRGCATDALDAEKPPTSSRRARRFVRRIEETELVRSPGVGLGEELSVRDGSLVASGSCLQDRLIHLAAFSFLEAA